MKKLIPSESTDAVWRNWDAAGRIPEEIAQPAFGTEEQTGVLTRMRFASDARNRNFLLPGWLPRRNPKNLPIPIEPTEPENPAKAMIKNYRR